MSSNISGVDDSAKLQTTLLAGGRSNISYKLTDASGSSWVLRRPPLGHIMPSAHDMGREFRVLSGLNSVSFPTPKAQGICTDEEIIGSKFMLMDFVDGRVIESAETAMTLSDIQAGVISQNLVDTLAKLHRVDPADAGLDQLGRPEGYLQRQVKRWGEQWQLTKTRELVEIEELHNWLEGAISKLPTNLPSAIVHGDYRIDNVILDPKTSEIIAVLDWEMSTLGDPISDLAISLVYWSQAGDTLRNQIPVAQEVTSGPGFWTREQVVQRYVSQTGYDISHLDECVALACFKLAVIMESIHHRNLSGQQLGAAAGAQSTMGQATIALTKLGLAVISMGAIAALNS
ncbi:MAG: phosphotransferase family protein [Candidatus Nanopelagicales bacterium]|jgi:aminoglycoside phosphotransferase (APT) family kinase protein|nr:phosphotransferase family protein [Candidatus Nanopelagicales bacterium]MDP4667107.1 phosphotransferase family protein [Candidatus Nanopelagicales bacterium]